MYVASRIWLAILLMRVYEFISIQKHLYILISGHSPFLFGVPGITRIRGMESGHDPNDIIKSKKEHAQQ